MAFACGLRHGARSPQQQRSRNHEHQADAPIHEQEQHHHRSRRGDGDHHLAQKRARHVHGHLQLLGEQSRNLPRALFREPPQRQAHDMVAQGVLQRMADLLDADIVAAIVREKADHGMQQRQRRSQRHQIPRRNVVARYQRAQQRKQRHVHGRLRQAAQHVQESLRLHAGRPPYQIVDLGRYHRSSLSRESAPFGSASPSASCGPAAAPRIAAPSTSSAFSSASTC